MDVLIAEHCLFASSNSTDTGTTAPRHHGSNATQQTPSPHRCRELIRTTTSHSVTRSSIFLTSRWRRWDAATVRMVDQAARRKTEAHGPRRSARRSYAAVHRLGLCNASIRASTRAIARCESASFGTRRNADRRSMRANAKSPISS